MIVSFYSYKGGVGRTQLCANIAAYLYYEKGKKILLWDWDFEAPGLHYFFGLKNNDISKKGTLELLEDYVAAMRKTDDVNYSDLTFVTKSENITSLLDNKHSSRDSGCIDLVAAGIYNNDFSWRSNNFDWFEFYNMMDGAKYIENLKENLKKLDYDYIFIDSRTGISDYSGICNIQLPDINVMVIAPTLQNFEGCKSIIEKIETADYLKIKKKNARILPILSRLDFNNPHYNDWIIRFTQYFSHALTMLDKEFDKEFIPEIFSDVYLKDTFLPYTQAISAGENILFGSANNTSSYDFARPFKKIAEFIESLKRNGCINFYKRIDEDSWHEYAEKAAANSQHRKAAIAYSQIGLKQDDTDEKIKYYNQSISFDQNYYLSYFYIGNSYSIKGHIEKSIEYFLKSIELEPLNNPAYFNIAVAYDRQKNFNKSIEYYLKAIESRPNYEDAFFNLGVVYRIKGEPDRAIEFLLRSIELRSDFEEAYNELGLAYFTKGETEKALTCFEKIIALNPSYEKAYLNLGIIYGDRGQVQKSIHYINKAIELKPTYTDAFFNLGMAYKSSGDLPNALKNFLQTIELDPNHEKAHFSLGTIYEVNGNSEKAHVHFQRSRELKSEDELKKAIEAGPDGNFQIFRDLVVS